MNRQGRANKLLSYIKRKTRSIQDTSLRRLMYLKLVRPLLGYASQIWAPQSVQLISCIERTQSRATKYILILLFLSPISYTERLRSLKLLPITYWHEYLDMIFFFKLTHGLVNVDSNTVPRIRSTGRNTRSNTTVIKYTVSRCRTQTFHKSFFTRFTRI